MATRGTRALQAGRVSVSFTVLAAATAIAAGTAVALLGFVFPDLGDDAAEAGSVPSRVDRVADLPILPTVLVAVALVLALASAALVLSASRTRPEVVQCVLLVAGPLVVLAGAAVVPHVVTPCLAGEVPTVCEADGQGGFDFPRTVHPLGHALLGWVPLTILYVWTLRRWWPAVLPRWVPGRSSEPRDVAASA
ncbi:hypothetical protein [Nocardioides sp. Soil805]|uniref:hypothetical protein n=1 Tax=Nocardioides sp. Soil805 TaxID=1736416 RepID=UPI0012E359AB|nr:hypothetical protein [Nocardioides sp. Soil805]